MTNPLRFLLALGLGLAASSVFASGQLDEVVSRLRSPRREVRQAAIPEFFRRYRTLSKEADRRPELNPKLKTYQPLWSCGSQLERALDAAFAPSARVRIAIMALAVETGWSDRSPSGEPSDAWICGVGTHNDTCKVEKTWAFRYAVSQRPDTVRNLIGDPGNPYKGYLFQSLLNLQDPRDQAIALRFATSDHASLQVMGIEALTHMPLGGLDAVLSGAEDSNPHVRFATAKALRTWGGERVDSALRKMLDDSSPVVQRAASIALDQPGLVEISVRGENGRPPAKRPTARIPRSVPDLIRLAYSSTKSEVFEALATADDPRARAAMLDLSESTLPEVKVAAILAMRLSRGVETENRLLQALKDPSPDVVSASLAAIAHREMKSAIPALRAMRQYEVGNPRAIDEALIACLEQCRMPLKAPSGPALDWPATIRCPKTNRLSHSP